MRDLLPKLEVLPWTYALPVLTLLLCLIAVWFWAYRRSAKEFYEQIALMPLHDEAGFDGRRKSTET